MPISPPIAASTELNACTSPPQQPFNNLSNQAGLRTPQHGFHSYFFLTQQSYYTCFFFLSDFYRSCAAPPTHMTHKALFFGLLSEVIVRNMGKLAGRRSSELMLSQYSGKITVIWTCTKYHKLRLFPPIDQSNQNSPLYHYESLPLPLLCPFVCPTFHSKHVTGTEQDSCQTSPLWVKVAGEVLLFFFFLPLLTALQVQHWNLPSQLFPL